MSLLQLVLRPADRTLIGVISQLPNLGIGARVARKSWLPFGDSYWEITDVKLKGEEASGGKVWGVLHWRGQRVDDQPRRVNGAAKKVWRWMPPGEEWGRLRGLAAEMQEQQQRRAAAAAAAGSSGGNAGK